MHRLDVYSRIPSTTTMAESIMMIMMELISILALVTKQVKQKRPGKWVLIDVPLV